MRPWRAAGTLLVALGVVAGASAADLASGQRLFAARCASCHAVGAASHSGYGPHLNALHGRLAGSAPGYLYSPAMKRSGIVWNDATLRAFLADPDEVVPGTKMRFWGMSDQRKVGDLLAYLRSAGAPPPVPPRRP